MCWCYRGVGKDDNVHIVLQVVVSQSMLPYFAHIDSMRMCLSNICLHVITVLIVSSRELLHYLPSVYGNMRLSFMFPAAAPPFCLMHTLHVLRVKCVHT